MRYLGCNRDLSCRSLAEFKKPAECFYRRRSDAASDAIGSLAVGWADGGTGAQIVGVIVSGFSIYSA